jgi:putative oxidoreductase
MSKKLISKESCIDYAYVVLRVLLGLMMFNAGATKLFGFITNGALGLAGMLGNTFGALGTPLAWIVVLVEIIAGVMLIIGFKVKWPAYLLAIVLVIATFLTGAWKWPLSSGLFFHIIAAVALAYVAEKGSGKFSVDSAMK